MLAFCWDMLATPLNCILTRAGARLDQTLVTTAACLLTMVLLGTGRAIGPVDEQGPVTVYDGTG